MGIIAGIASVVELKQSSVMQRLLTGWMPTAIRGDHGPSDRALSLAVHCVEHDAFIFALCQDHKLRMWSYKVSTTLELASVQCEYEVGRIEVSPAASFKGILWSKVMTFRS